MMHWNFWRNGWWHHDRLRGRDLERSCRRRNHRRESDGVVGEALRMRREEAASKLYPMVGFQTKSITIKSLFGGDHIVSAGTYDMQLDQYSDWSLPITIRDSNGNLIDFAQVDLNVVDPATGEQKAFFSSAGGSTPGCEVTLADTAPNITLVADNAATSLMIPGTYKYDMVTTVGIVKTRQLQGSFTVNAGITTS